MKKFSLFVLFVCFAQMSKAGVLGDFQTFTPNTDGLYFVSVDSGQTLKAGNFVANGYISFARNHILAYDNLVDKNRIDYKDQLTEFDSTIGYSLTDRFQIFLGLTTLIDQKPDEGQGTDYFLTRGVHSYRPGFKWQFSASQRSRWALMTSVDILNVKDDPYTGIDPDPIPNVQLAWSGALGNSHTHGFNLGYRMRRPSSEPVPGAGFFPLKDQLTFSYGYSHFWSKPTRLIFETIGCYPLDKGQNKTNLDVSCLEFLGALRYRYSNTWAYVVGATVEAPGVQTMAPAWRVFAGANFYWPTKSAPADNSSGKNSVAAEPLQIVPSDLELLTDEKVPLSVSGGKGPYVFDVVEGGGRIEEESGAYRAPPEAGTARIRVTDANLDEAFATVSITAPKVADEVVKLEGLNFEFDSTEITANSRPRLEQTIRKLKTMAVRELIVSGHTDDIGSAEYNEDLSARRAKAIAEILSEALGLPIEKVRAIGYGMSRPVVPNMDDESRAKNRRVELAIYK